MVLDHIAEVHAVSPPLHTIYTYKIGKAVILNNSLALKSSSHTSTEDEQKWRPPQHLIKLLDDSRMETIIVVICRHMHGGKEVNWDHRDTKHMMS